MGKNGKSLNVLLLEDNVHHAELLTNIIEANFAPATVHITETLEDFLEFVQQYTYDIVFSDCFVRNRSIAPHLARIRKLLGNIPLVMITGSGDEELAAETIKRGATEYIVKSKDSLKNIPDTVSRLVQRSKKADASKGITGDVRRLSEQAKKIISSKTTKQASSDIKELDNLLNKIQKIK